MKRTAVLLAFFLLSCFSGAAGQLIEQKLGMVVADPRDKHNIRGYVHMAIIYGEELRSPAAYPRYLINLKEAFSQWTKINVILDRPCELSSPRLLELPFVYITSYDEFVLTPLERENVRNYFKSGGFMVLDNARPTIGESPQEKSFRNMLLDALGPDIQFLPIPSDHPLFNVYFDLVEGPPVGVLDDSASIGKFFLSGVWANGRLVAILSNRGYTVRWSSDDSNQPQLRFGINMVIYALTRENNDTNIHE
ncbi:DUF4159 domain-containing protein [bacterium]|nr:DUF4159 domain-containing protein [bacterium]